MLRRPVQSEMAYTDLLQGGRIGLWQAVLLEAVDQLSAQGKPLFGYKSMGLNL